MDPSGPSSSPQNTDLCGPIRRHQTTRVTMRTTDAPALPSPAAPVAWLTAAAAAAVAVAVAAAWGSPTAHALRGPPPPPWTRSAAVVLPGPTHTPVVHPYRRRFLLSAAAAAAADSKDKEDDDDDEDPALYKKLLDTQIVLALTAKGTQAFDFFRTPSALLTPAALYQWEQQVDALSAELTQLTNKDALLAVYASLLRQVAPTQLDPLQMATFQLLSNAIVDALVRLRLPGAPVTALIDEITDVHLDFVDQFQTLIDDGGDDGYSQSSTQEYLAYQLAGLVRRTYARQVCSSDPQAASPYHRIIAARNRRHRSRP